MNVVLELLLGVEPFEFIDLHKDKLVNLFLLLFFIYAEIYA